MKIETLGGEHKKNLAPPNFTMAITSFTQSHEDLSCDEHVPLGAFPYQLSQTENGISERGEVLQSTEL